MMRAMLTCGLLLVAALAFPRASWSASGEEAAPALGGSDGLLRLNLPLEIPVGTGGIPPSPGLHYASAHQDGPFGVGWALGFGEIRRTSRFGTPLYDDAVDQFELDGQLLVPGATAGRYHTDVETFQRIEFQTTDPHTSAWEVTLPGGTILRYGLSSATRIETTVVPAPANYVARWLLEEMEDVHGNRAKFEYASLGDPGMLYPTRISYSYDASGAAIGELREVQFAYEDRPDPVTSFRGGVRTEISKRANEIWSTVGGSPYRRYLLAYSTSPHATGRSLLASVQRYGTDCPTGTDPNLCAAEPPQTFVYADAADVLATPAVAEDNWQPTAGWVSPVAFLRAPSSGPTEFLGVLAGDVNGDGLPDLVRAFEDSDGTSVHEVYLNTGSGWALDSGPGSWSEALTALSYTSTEVEFVKSGTDVTSVLHNPFTSEVFLNSARDWKTPATPDHFRPPTNAQLVDVDGDGRVDLVVSSLVGQGSIDCGSTCQAIPGTRVAAVFLNTGSGWQLDPVLSASIPPLESVWFRENEGGIAIGEAPGSPDVLVAQDASGNPLAVMQHYLLSTALANLNGDGWIDVVSRPDDVGPPDPNGIGLHPLDTGLAASAWLGSASGWAEAPTFVPPTPLVGVYFGEAATPLLPAIDGPAGVVLVDVNGDGLDDFVKTAVGNSGGFLVDPTWYPELLAAGVWLNTGTGWCGGPPGCDVASYSLPTELTRVAFSGELFGGSGFSTPIIRAGTWFADLNGDGLVDLARADSTAFVQEAWIQDPSAPSGCTGRWCLDVRFRPTTEMDQWAVLPQTQAVPRGVLLSDVDGDGGVDAIRAVDPGGAFITSQHLGRVAQSDLVSQRLNGRGGAWSYSYEGAPAQRDPTLEALAESDEAAEPLGPGEVIRWDHRPVLREVAVSGLAAGPYVTDFSYARPRYSTAQRMTRGFRVVEAHRPDTSILRTYYWQRRGAAGAPSRGEIRSATGDLLRVATLALEVLDGSAVTGSASGVAVSRIAETEVYNVYGGASGAHLREVRAYDDAYGYNFVSRVDRYRPSGVSTEEYLPTPADTAGWIFGLRSLESLKDAYGGLVSVRAHQYVQGQRTQSTHYLGTRGDSILAMTPHVESWTYDTYGNLTSHTDLESRVTQLCYDGDLTLGGATCPAAPTATHTHVVGILDPLGEVTALEPDPASGAVRGLTEHNNDHRWAVVDPWGRPLEIWDQPAGLPSGVRLRHHVYGDFPSGSVGPFVETFVSIDGSVDARSAAYGDGLGRPQRSVADGPTGTVGVVRSFDYAGRVLSESYPAACASADCAALVAGSTSEVTLVWDELGRVLTRTDLDGVQAMGYGTITRTQFAGPGSLGQDHVFDAVLAKDARGKLRERLLDQDLGVWMRICSNEVSPAATDLIGVSCSPAEETFYVYDADGSPKEIYDAIAVGDPASRTDRHRFQWTYDTLGRPLEVRDPDAGVSQFTYLLTGEIETQTTARSLTTTYSYDALGRVEGVDRPGTEPDLSVTYDPVTRRPDYVGEVGGYHEDLQYDDFGRLDRRSVHVGSHDYVMEWDYDLRGDVVRVGYPVANLSAHYEYVGGFLDRICTGADALASCDDSAALVHVTGVTYDALGRQDLMTQRAGTLDYNYDSRFHLGQTTFTANDGTAVLNLGYAYDPAGNVAQITDDHTPTTDPIRSAATFTYDRQNRLESHDLLGTPTYFSYDVLGNLTGRSVSTLGAQNQQFDDPAIPHAVSAVVDEVSGAVLRSFGYDAEGNRTVDGTRSYTYDSAGRMICAGTVGAGSCDVASLAYDAGGRRIRTAPAGGDPVVYLDPYFSIDTTTLQSEVHILARGQRIATRYTSNTQLRTRVVPWVPLEVPPWGPVVVALVAAGGALLWGAWSRRRVPAAPRPAWLRSIATAIMGLVMLPPGVAWAGGGGSGGTWFYYASDALGTALVVLDGLGELKERRVVEPFGEMIANSNGTPTYDEVFTSKERDPGVGLFDFGARWYDSATGSFTTVDPLIGDLGQPADLNAFAYVRNQPLNRIDPDGSFSIPVLVGLGMIGPLKGFHLEALGRAGALVAGHFATATLEAGLPNLGDVLAQIARGIAEVAMAFQNFVRTLARLLARTEEELSPVLSQEAIRQGGSQSGFPDVSIDPRGFSREQVGLIGNTLGFLRENYPGDFGQRLNEPIRIVQRDNLRDPNALAETGFSARGDIEIALHLDALRNANNFRSVLGHEFVHAFDISLERVPYGRHGDVMSELNGLNWEWRNAGQNRITTPYRMRLQEQIQDWRRR